MYNPLSGNQTAEEDAELLRVVLDAELLCIDITTVTNYKALLGSMEPTDFLVLLGGDGTLNRFVNDTEGIGIRQEIYYYPTGTSNDFAMDLGRENCRMPFPISGYLKNLPCVTVQGKTCRFLNGVGFGIDGYCCQAGDALRKIPGRKVNYTGIAIKGLLRYFAPRNATVTVDGKEYTYKKVWIAPTMHGKFYGGGMIPTPRQDRNSGKLSVMLFHGAGRIRTLCVFPGIFKGTHIKHKNMVAVHTGNEITVEFDQPTPLQIDGETILGVTKYTAHAAKVKEKV